MFWTFFYIIDWVILKVKIIIFIFIINIKSIKIKLEKKCKKFCSYIYNIIKLLTFSQFKIIIDFLIK